MTYDPANDDLGLTPPPPDYMDRRLKYKINRHNARVPRVTFMKVAGKIFVYVSRLLLLGSALSTLFFLPHFYGPIGYLYAAISIAIVYVFILFTARDEI